MKDLKNYGPRMELHTHTGKGSNIRLIDSICSPKGLIDRAIELNLAGISFTDHESLSAHPEVLKYFETIKEEHPDFKVCLGNEIYLVDERPADSHYHYILLSKDKEGHKQLRILSSLAWINNYHAGMERVDTLKSDLERIVKQNPGHLIASSACIGGELGKRILSMTAAEKMGDKDTANKEHNAIVKYMLWNKELFGEDFYIETQPGVSREQIIVNQRLVSIAQCFDVKVICSSDAHYLKKEDRFIHKSFLNSKDGGDREVDAFYADAYLHSNEEMIEKYGKSGFDRLFVEKMFSNTMEIYDKIENYTLFHPQQIPMVEVKDYPKRSCTSVYPILESLFQSDDKIERYWINECYNKLKELGKDNETYLSRLEEEAKVKRIIGEKLGTNIFAYPVTLQYYINRFWELGSPVGAGRGSSCSGLNHYLLGVTQLDPIEWDLPFWRYLNEDRAELPDIDLDLAPSKKPLILAEIKKERGRHFYEGIEDEFRRELGCVMVATFGTETSKSAILTACRGYRSEEYTDGIDVDTAQYLSSLVPVERGFVWSISDVYYGNENKDRKPIIAFKNEVDQYPGLLDIMLGVEGMVSRRGSHASGIIFNDEDPFEFGAYMKTPSGDVITQYDLHDAEWCGATKYDALVTEIQDKIAQSIKFLQENEEIEKDLTLRQAYDKYLHPSVLPIEDEECWKAIQRVEVLDLFQFDSVVGNQAAKKIKPRTMLELADSNGLMRLMAMETGETPLDKYVRFKNDISQWYKEMREDYHLTEDDIVAVKRHFARSHGVPPSQEQLMTMLMDEDICHFTLAEANAARKVVGKKLLSKVPALHEKVISQAKNENLGRYIWDCGIGPQISYSFSIIHALAYSFIAFQSAYIATKWNPIYWNTACLVVNSGSLEEEDVEIVSIYEKEDSDCEYEDLPDRSGKKKKDKGSDYSKIAKAIGAIRNRGIEVSLININTSDYGFKPDIKNNRILYGLKALSNINAEVVEKIKNNRPYVGIKDFMIRCPLTKTAMIMLIKSGAFDEIETTFNNRKEIMAYYLYNNCDAKKKLTLLNFNGLITHNLVPKDFEMEVRVFNFNKYIKNFKVSDYYKLDNNAMMFFEKFLGADAQENIEYINDVPCILQTSWKKIYDLYMDNIREWLKDNQTRVLDIYNRALFLEMWNKYAAGTVSAWEMDSLCFYYGRHELADVDICKYGIANFNELKSCDVDYYWKRNGHDIPIYKLSRIIGTVIAKDDTRHSVTLLTTTGVVPVKFTGDYYSMFKKQISELGADGKKHVIEKSWFKRGTMLMITGFRREDQFVGKTYKNTGSHQLYKITNILNGEITLQHDRYSGKDSIEEDE